MFGRPTMRRGDIVRTKRDLKCQDGSIWIPKGSEGRIVKSLGCNHPEWGDKVLVVFAGYEFEGDPIRFSYWEDGLELVRPARPRRSRFRRYPPRFFDN
jgi:hypothetical protein